MMGKDKMGMLGVIGTKVGKGPTKTELCTMKMGYGVSQILASEGADGMEAGPRDIKAPGFYRIEDNQIIRGSFCSLTNMWYWSPVATCKCDKGGYNGDGGYNGNRGGGNNNGGNWGNNNGGNWGQWPNGWGNGTWGNGTNGNQCHCPTRQTVDQR